MNYISHYLSTTIWLVIDYEFAFRFDYELRIQKNAAFSIWEISNFDEFVV